MWGDKRGLNWTGMISSLTKNEMDLVATSLTLSPDRADVVDFLPTLGTGLNLLQVKCKS